MPASTEEKVEVLLTQLNAHIIADQEARNRLDAKLDLLIQRIDDVQKDVAEAQAALSLGKSLAASIVLFSSVFALFWWGGDGAK